FVSGVLVGYSFVSDFPEETREIIERMKELFASGEKMTDFQIFLFILENNITKLLLMLLLGIFAGIIPLFASFANGMILGIFARLISESLSWEFFLVGILPHGVIEIPVLILATATGMRIGKVVLWRLFGGEAVIKKELAKAFKFYIIVLVPLLILAAVIEAFITSALLDRV
ncbi:MAG: stage II sporulation protein M, partial [Patescibacteria group bacterium]|nr:stage II sporulation protein M [Patescibacteria group bacterium]